MLLNCWRRLLRVPWTAKRSNQSNLEKISPEYSLKGLVLKLNSNTLATWLKNSPWKRPWCWKWLKAREEGNDRGWDVWMASLTQWTGVWANSRWSWMTWKPGVLQSMWSQRVRHNWVIERRWHQPKKGISKNCLMYKQIILEVLCEFQYNFDFYAKYFFASFYSSWMY